MEALGRKELIIHPVYHSEEITLFIENNGPKTLLFNHPAELERLFASNEKVEFLLDLAP